MTTIHCLPAELNDLTFTRTQLAAYGATVRSPLAWPARRTSHMQSMVERVGEVPEVIDEALEAAVDWCNS
jgi:hypothetical protein